MDDAKVLLNAYYEALHEKLVAGREILAARIDKLLRLEVAERGFKDFDEKKYAAYREACLAFIDERIETYNPIGIQYTFDHTRRKEAFQLELQLDWYDSRAEYDALVAAALARTQEAVTQEQIAEVTEELINKVGAFPDKSIISGYQAGPALGKLPDYIVARAIEEIMR